MLGFVGALAGRLPRAARPNLTSTPRCCATRPPALPDATMVRARHILVESEEMIDSVAEQLRVGKARFAELASIVSTCPSKARGGDLGWFRRNQMVKGFEAAAFANPPGAVVKLQTEFGWHLLLVEEHGNAPEEMSVREYADRVRDGTADELQRVDCREKVELEKAALPGFLNLPMGEYGRWVEEFERGEITLDKEKETVVMCHHGLRSANFCSFLRQQGFRNVKNLVGGIDAYAKEVDDSVPLY